MLSISTLQIQSVKKRYQKRPHFIPETNTTKEKNEIRNEMPPCWLSP